jgi:glycosyltransferase involved in cell wall biosynthesis
VPSKQLILVMPVYNEEECIVGVVGDWLATFERLGIDAAAMVLDDGSRDASWERLQVYADDPRVILETSPNSGHGPTILRGYRRALAMGDWVFQCDSDDEMSSEHFGEVWKLRENNDAVFGYRHGRAQDPVRCLVTWVSRGTVRVLFGDRVRDVNTPYRLMRTDSLGRILASVPDDTFAPNIMIAGGYSLGSWRVAEVAVPHRPRQTGSASLFRWGLLRAAVRSFGQTLRFRAKLDRRALSGGAARDGAPAP